ncbi:MAG: PAS domain-containing protein [Desulfobacterales bacterium]|jgi:PAS domain S-box-containing protein|nr:PAS domain-containing protein [Desulfobacterales bacterium]
MEIRRKILLSVGVSLVISLMFGVAFFTAIRGIDKEVERIRVFDMMKDKAQALSLLSARFPSSQDPSRIHQIKKTQQSLADHLGGITGINAREEALLRQMKTNLRDAGQTLEKLIPDSFQPKGSNAIERYNLLVSHLWMETQVISDDAQRLIDISHARILASRQHAGLLTFALIVALILINAAISFFSGAHLARLQEELRRALTRAEEGDRMLSAMMAYVPEGIVMADEKLTLKRVSRHAEEVYGVANEGKSVAEAVAQLQIYSADGDSPLVVDDLPLVRAVRSGEIVKDVELVQVTDRGEKLPVLCTAAPIRDAAGRVTGGIVTWRDIREIKNMMQSLENIVSERTAQLRLRNRELQELTRQNISVMENDRKALAKEIHDGIGGSLSAIKLLLESRVAETKALPPEGIFSLEQIIGYLADTIKESKRISYQMRSPALDEFGLTAAVAENIKKFKEYFPKIEVDFNAAIPQDEIADEIRTIVYRVVQEALTNIGKHSGADKVRIELAMGWDRLLLKVDDNGCGFDVRQTLEMDQMVSGFGLRSMKERVEICKGTFDVFSAPGKGTILSASIPTIETRQSYVTHRPLQP